MSLDDSFKKVFNEAFRQNIIDVDNQNAIVGTVVSIDEAKALCSIQPIDKNRTIIENILLSSSDDGKTIFTPTIGTTVSVCMFDKESGYVASQGATSKVNLNAGLTDYGGLIKIEDLVTKINNLEDKVNTLISWLTGFATAYNTHTHVCAAPTYPSGLAVPPESKTSEPPLINTTRIEIENDTVIHGDGVADKVSYIQKIKTASEALVTAEKNLSDAVISNPSQKNITNLKKIVAQKQSEYNSLIQNPE